MATAIREFLEAPKVPIAEMSFSDLQVEVEGWRAMFGLLPIEVVTWLTRLQDTVRFTKRNYQGQIGVLLGFKLEATEFSIAIQEVVFDSLSGQRFVEDKVLVIPANAVMFYEFIGDRTEYDPTRVEEELGAEILG